MWSSLLQSNTNKMKKGRALSRSRLALQAKVFECFLEEEAGVGLLVKAPNKKPREGRRLYGLQNLFKKPSGDGRLAGPS